MLVAGGNGEGSQRIYPDATWSVHPRAFDHRMRWRLERSLGMSAQTQSGTEVS